MRSHMTGCPFRCYSCYKCFSDEAGLRDHIPKHNETKHLKTKICSVCGKSYAQETYLARHMLRHQVSATDGARRDVRPTLPPITFYSSQLPTTNVSTSAYQSAVGSCYPQPPSGVLQSLGTETVGFRGSFLRSEYIPGDQLN